MTRRFSLSIGAACLTACLAAIWSIEALPTESWMQQFSRDRDGELGGFGVPNYPIRMELPPLQAAVDAAASPSAQPGLTATLPSAAAERVEDWIMGEPRLAAKPIAAPFQAPAEDKPALIPTRFDIATFGHTATEADTEFRARKPLIVSGERVGAVELAMGQGSIVSVDRAELAGLLGDRAPELSAALARLGTERVTFDTLRTREIRIRYDALSDAVVIESRS